MNAARLSLFLLPLLAASAWLLAEEKPRPARLDVTKTRRVERPAEEVLAASSAVPEADAAATPEADRTKELRIERPAVEVLASSSHVSVPAAAVTPRAIVTPDVAAQLMVAAQIARLADRGKGDVEIPLKEVIAGRQLRAAENVSSVNGVQPNGQNEPPPADPAAVGFVNPKVEPGKVHWHADFAAARAASEQSGKPVLLFQMMGKLDDRFC